MSEGAPQRLRIERERLGLNQRAMGQLGKVSKNTQLAYETAASSIPLDYLIGLAEHGVDIQYVATGHRSSDFDESWGRVPNGRDDRDDEVEIDSIDLSYGMGGTFVDVEPGAMEIAKAKFSGSWLRKFTHSPPAMLFTTSGIGDSMRPTIEDSDIVIVDRSESLRTSLGERIWAIVFGGVGMIKRLRPMPDGTVKIMSDNQSVRDDVATDQDLHVVGRVVAVVRRH